MTENKRFKMKKLEYESYFIDSQQEYVDEDEPNFKIDGEKTMSDSQILDLLNKNEQLKQSYKEFEEECQSTFNAMSRKQKDLYRKNFKLKEENEQFKEKIFSLFDKEIARNEEAIEWGEKIGGDIGSIGFYNHMLKMLKKELQEWLMKYVNLKRK